MWEYAVYLAQRIATLAQEMKDRPSPVTAGQLKATNQALDVYIMSLEEKTVQATPGPSRF